MSGLEESRTHCTTSSMLNTLSGIRAVGRDGGGEREGREGEGMVKRQQSEVC